jgi:hypothetical protein
MRLRIVTSDRTGAGRMRRAFGLGAASALIAGATVMAGGIAGAATPKDSTATTTSWIATATQALDLVDATSLGSVPASTPLNISVVLNVQNPAKLASLAQAASTVGSAT